MDDKFRKSYILAAAFILVLNILDLVTTYGTLWSGSVEELNPIAQFMLDTKLLIPSKILICGSILYGSFRGPAKSLPILNVAWWVVGVYSIIVVLNALTWSGVV